MNMSNSVSLLFPHQLYDPHPAIDKKRPVYLVEEWLYFNQYPFHKQKLWLHRASMKAFADRLREQGYSVTYVDCQQPLSDVRALIGSLSKKNISEIVMVDPSDFLLQKRIIRACENADILPVFTENPNFVTPIKTGLDFLKQEKTLRQTSFYIWQRKRLAVLLEKNERPTGGKWSFDDENRKRLTKDVMVPIIAFPKSNKYTQEAKTYIEDLFPNNPGEINETLYPIQPQDVEAWWLDFLKTRFRFFGDYEDAIAINEWALYHSVLTPMLNIGLLNPRRCLQELIHYAQEQNIPINNTEGFVRQLIGWREFMRLVYEAKGVEQRTKNYWGFSRKIPRQFWDGTTGIEPIDRTIKKLLKTGYCHHIERLMVLGNFMLLCEFDPNDVYAWFMVFFIDAYDWVMVPNIYGMTQFADGGLMTTKPYISGSNYLMKMSDYPKGSWQEIWDALFWRFMHVHRSFFLQNPRLGMLVRTWDKMPEEKRKKHLQTADTYLLSLND
jgi:deoxyribodipyrimidine photolyase-related protein